MTSRKYHPLYGGIKSPGASASMPILFQVLSPDHETTLIPEAMYLHVNPTSIKLDYQKTISRFPTLGGFHEQHWPDQLSSISASNTTGAFISIEEGLATRLRHETISRYKFESLKELFHNNGVIADDRGRTQFRGRIRLTFAGGIYDGFFKDFSISEDAETPFQFSFDWSFIVEKEARSLLI